MSSDDGYNTDMTVGDPRPADPQVVVSEHPVRDRPRRGGTGGPPR